MIAPEIESLKNITECPVTSLTHWRHAATVELGVGNTGLKIFGQDNWAGKAVLTFEVPSGDSLVITKIDCQIQQPTTNLAKEVAFALNYRFYFDVNNTLKTTQIRANVLTGDCFLIFNQKDRVKLHGYYNADLYNGEFDEMILSVKLNGFLIEGNLTERLKPLETNFT